MRALRRFALGVTYLLIVVAAGAFAIAMNRGVFQHNTPIEVISDRAGLTLADGARVKFRGVDVGTVASIDPVPAGARIRVNLFDSQVKFVPADVTAHIIPPTAFGAKYIDLVVAHSGGQSIEADAQVQTTQVTTEFNDTFANLTKLLDAAQPEKVNAALTASANALYGRGTDLGKLLSGLDSYLGEFNSSLPALSRDLSAAVPVAEVYNRSADNIVTLLNNLGETSRTATAQPSALAELLAGVSRFSATTGGFLNTNQPGIQKVVNLFDPVTAALAQYAPELPCTFGGVVVADNFVERAIGGVLPGYNVDARFVPAGSPYRYPANLPKIGEDRGPQCYGLPVVNQADAARQLPIFNVGAGPGTVVPTSPGNLATTFFGPLAPLLGAR